MTVFKLHRKSNYTVIDNGIFMDKRLSAKAKGILCQLLSLPDEWNYSIQGLSSLFSDGKDSIRNGINELEKFGYVKRTQIVNESHHFSGYQYDVYECPMTSEPLLENATTDKPHNKINNNKVSSNELSINKNKEKNIKKESVKSLISDYTQNEELKDCLFSFVEMRKNVKKPLTARAMKLSLNGLDKLALDDETKIAIVDNSILHNWLTFYPLEKKKNEKSREEMGYAF